MRHAILRHLKWMERIEDVPSVSAQLEAMNLVLYQDQLNEEFLDAFNKISPRMHSLVQTGDYDEAHRLFNQLLDCVDRMPRGYWKKRSLDKLYNEHGWVLKQKDDEMSKRSNG